VINTPDRSSSAPAAPPGYQPHALDRDRGSIAHTKRAPDGNPGNKGRNPQKKRTGPG